MIHFDKDTPREEIIQELRNHIRSGKVFQDGVASYCCIDGFYVKIHPRWSDTALKKWFNGGEGFTRDPHELKQIVIVVDKLYSGEVQILPPEEYSYLVEEILEDTGATIDYRYDSVFSFGTIVASLPKRGGVTSD